MINDMTLTTVRTHIRNNQCWQLVLSNLEVLINTVFIWWYSNEESFSFEWSGNLLQDINSILIRIRFFVNKQKTVLLDS